MIERLRKDATVYGRGVGFVYYLIADMVASANDDVLSELADSIEDIESELLDDGKSPALPRLFALKRSLSVARRFLSPQRDLFAMLTKLGGASISDRTALYFRDVYDKVVRANESIEASRDLASNVLDAHFFADVAAHERHHAPADRAERRVPAPDVHHRLLRPELPHVAVRVPCAHVAGNLGLRRAADRNVVLVLQSEMALIGSAVPRPAEVNSAGLTQVSGPHPRNTQ